jgi:hypothetical protein
MNKNSLSEGERAVFHRVFPLLDEITQDLNVHVDFLTFCGVARRLASRGYELEKLQNALREHYEHQTQYLTKRKH